MARAAAIELTALEHLHELMQRLLWSVGFMIGGGAIAYIFRLQIIDFLQRPLHQNLYYTSPMGSFQFVMQVCLLSGLLCALPVLLYNLLRFIEPAFARSLSNRMVLIVLGSSLFLTLAGAAFAYYVTLPAALHFFNSVGTNKLHALISINEYFSFMLGYLGTFAIVFQLPLVLLFIDHIKPLDPGSLSKKRTIVYVGAFGISLIMPSSPDPLSQVSLAIPIIILYELSIVLIKIAHRKQRRKIARAERLAAKATPVADRAEPAPPAEAFSFNFADVQPIMAGADFEVSAPVVQEAPAPTPVVTPAQPKPAPEPRRRSIDDVSRRPSVVLQRANYQTMRSRSRRISDVL